MCPQVSLSNHIHESALKQKMDSLKTFTLVQTCISQVAAFNSSYVPTVRFVPSIYFLLCNSVLIHTQNCSGTSTSPKVTTQKQRSVETKLFFDRIIQNARLNINQEHIKQDTLVLPLLK